MPDEIAHEYIAFVAEFYELDERYQKRGDKAFYIDLAREYGDPVLEIACGTGRIALPMAQAGIEVVGLDLSEHMLNIFRGKLASEPIEVASRIELHKGDMRQFDLREKFPLVTIPFNSFAQMLTTEDQFAVLDAARRHLVPGGRLVLDIFSPYLPYLVDESRKEKVSEGGPVTLPDGRTMSYLMRDKAHDWIHQLVHVEHIFTVTYPDGRSEELLHEFSIRYLYRWELEHLLARAGFKIEKMYGGFDRRPFGESQPGLMLTVATPV